MVKAGVCGSGAEMSRACPVAAAVAPVTSTLEGEPFIWLLSHIAGKREGIGSKKTLESSGPYPRSMCGPCTCTRRRDVKALETRACIALQNPHNDLGARSARDSSCSPNPPLPAGFTCFLTAQPQF
jgi:hypothetical protein